LLYRLLYKLWRFFWILTGTLLAVVLTLAICIIFALQLPSVQNYLADEVVTTFNDQFEGELIIERVSGFLPLRAEIIGGRVYSPENDDVPVIRFEEASVTVNWWELLRQNLTISSFELTRPVITLSMEEDELNLDRAFRQKEEVRTRRLLEGDTPQIFQRVDIFAPHLSIIDGTLTADESIALPPVLQLPSPLRLEEINAGLFFEVTETQLYADLLNLRAEIPDSDFEFVQLSGQFFTDDRFLELNRIALVTGIGHLDFSLEATPVNLLGNGSMEEIRQAEYRAEIRESELSPRFVEKFYPDFPATEQNLVLEASAEGTASELFVDRLQLNLGQTSLLLTGELSNLLDNRFSYRVNIDHVLLHPDEVRTFAEEYVGGTDLQQYQLSTLHGNLSGNLDSLATNLQLETAAGELSLDGSLGFHSPFPYAFTASVDSLDITPFTPDTSKQTLLAGTIETEGQGFDETAHIRSSVDLDSSIIAGQYLDRLHADLEYNDRRLRYDFLFENEPGSLRAGGDYIRTENEHQFTVEGNLNQADLARYTDFFGVNQTRFTGTFSANLRGNDLEDMNGRVSIEMDESMIGADSLRAHQLYADITAPENGSRRLRFTSSFLDGEMRGTLSPDLIGELASHWGDYLQDRVRNEFLFDEEFEFSDELQRLPSDEEISAEISVELLAKDLDLLRLYLPDLPAVQSRARMNATVQADRDEFYLSGNLSDQFFRYDDKILEHLNSSVSASFRHGQPFSEYNNVDLQINFEKATINEMDLRESYLNLSMRNDSLQVRQHFLRADSISVESSFAGKISPGMLEVDVDEFNLGSPRYNWYTTGSPKVVYTDRHALTLRDVQLTSDNDLLEINGTFSSNPEDSVEYRMDNFDLQRISDLIGGRITFSGIANGEFVTRSLTQTPSVQGYLEVDEGRILDRLIGDVNLNSVFNPDENRFDTDIRVYTDPEKYPEYYRRNDQIGQDLRFTGYFKIPEQENPDEDFLYFDADLREIDMWIVTFIAPAIVYDMEGSSSGTGFIRASRNDYDFEGVFDIEDVYGVPFFMNVGYTLSGELVFNRSDGLLFNDIRLEDSDGGNGLLYGQVDLDDFSPDNYLDLTLDLNNLHFMNNPQDPDVPFYSSLYGTGQARISGSNFSPFLRTTTPIVLSSNSRVSIPLEEETEFEQDRRFIQFVDSFDLAALDERLRRERDENGDSDDNDDELTFLERFTMDMQFSAVDPVNVRLIFDPVTNEILNANGNGQVRILLEDQDVSMFGRFNIQGGDYQFVSGDIFTRRFTLQEGGSISWQGDLIDASLNVTAVYRARPSISTLLASTTATTQQDTGQRIPVELVLQIGGTITQVENDFFFRVPTGIEGTLDPTIATQINNLNQNEEEKLVQATSILLSGNFLPSSQAQNLGLGEGITGTAAVVNPLLTSQVINPLLSNQINSLLRSDITFDIDLNLTAFNEVDLGVALRLFDDRVILRREGQITGEQSDIGDLGATYRINRIFSLTAFHRQDPTLSYTSGVETRQAQEMNGLGLEAQVQFNTWGGFRERISDAVRSMFGIQRKEEEENDDEDRESIVEN
jgi:translocation and assembly module TamB